MYYQTQRIDKRAVRFASLSGCLMVMTGVCRSRFWLRGGVNGRALVSGVITNGTISEGIALQHCAAVFDPMSHIGTNAQQSGLVPHSSNCDAYVVTGNFKGYPEAVCLDNV